MEEKDMNGKNAGKRPLTAADALARLLAIMVGWWAGRTLAELGREHGISRQRAGALLAGVDCTAAARRKAKRQKPDSGRRAMARHMDEARQALLHPLAGRLTARQRGALAWRAQGLVLTDIAKRMGTTAQGVRQHLVGARWRLERLAARKAASGVATELLDIAPIDCSDLDRGGAGGARGRARPPVRPRRPTPEESRHVGQTCAPCGQDSPENAEVTP